MRKNILAVSIAAMIGGLGFAGAASAAAVIDNAAAAAVPNNSGAAAPADVYAAPASALEVTPTGVGHILTVPYFSTQNGNVSLLNITNTDLTNGKAVKLRYRGAANSDDIYDITIYLSPGDIWSANVSQKDGVSYLETADNSCTLPAAVNAPFSTNRVGGDTQEAKNAQTLEGYVEILNTADVPPFLADDAAGDGALTTTVNPLFTTIKHVAGVAPCGTTAAGAAVLDQQLNDVDVAGSGANAWTTRGYNFPTGGLMANWSIINLAKAGSFTGEATAVLAVDAAGVSSPANIVFSPQTDTAVAAAVVNSFTADPLLRQNAALAPIVQAANYDFPDLSTPYAGAVHPIDQANELSSALAVQSVFNEYLTNPAVSFGTDWVFSMPTRRYGVALNYTTGTAVFNAVAVAPGAGAAADTAIPPVLNIADPYGSAFFTSANSTVNSTKNLICVKPGSTGLQYFDHSEQSTKNGFVISPGSVATLEFCGETSVLAFNNTGDSVLGSKIARKDIATKKSGSSTIYTDGWLKVGTPGLNGTLVAHTNAGLPVSGHAYVKALSSSANLGGTWRHRFSK